MAHVSEALNQTPAPGIVTSVRMVADRLIRSARRNGMGASLDQQALLERLLAVAVEAEQRIAEQRHRIAVLEALSVTDELTGLINRRGFRRELCRALADARRRNTGGALAYLDVDDFKKVNDIFGHQVGDEVLHRVAEVLTCNVRTNDVVARLGGDEFAVLVTHSSIDDGLSRVCDIEHILNRASIIYGNQKIPIRASFGVVTYDGDGDPEDVMMRADRAMYANKHRDEAVLHPVFNRADVA